MSAPPGFVDPLQGHPRYRTIKYVNKGSFGFVVLAENLETHEQVAIKFVEVSCVCSPRDIAARAARATAVGRGGRGGGGEKG